MAGLLGVIPSSESFISDAAFSTCNDEKDKHSNGDNLGTTRPNCGHVRM